MKTSAKSSTKAWPDMSIAERKAYYAKANKAALAAFRKLVADKTYHWNGPRS